MTVLEVLHCAADNLVNDVVDGSSALSETVDRLLRHWPVMDRDELVDYVLRLEDECNEYHSFRGSGPDTIGRVLRLRRLWRTAEHLC